MGSTLHLKLGVWEVRVFTSSWRCLVGRGIAEPVFVEFPLGETETLTHPVSLGPCVNELYSKGIVN